MAFTSILRKSANSLVPLAIRLTRVQQNYHSCIFTALNHSFQSQKPAVNHFHPNTLHFSTAVSRKVPSDESLIRVLESEIQCAEESDECKAVEAPSGFPFEIKDTPGLQTVTLTREYDGELIKVDVHMPDLVTGDENEEDEDNDEGDYEKPSKSSMPLVVNVSKRDGTSLEFNCTAFPDEIAIDSLTVRNPDSQDDLAYEGPDFHDLDENLQKAFHKYLEIRGIKPGTTNFLHEYMINKDGREYPRWLKNIKKFIEE